MPMTQAPPTRLECDPKGAYVCTPMAKALDGQHDKALTGLVRNLMPPHLIGVRFRDEGRKMKVLILRVCPWCGTKLPQAKVN